MNSAKSVETEVDFKGDRSFINPDYVCLNKPDDFMVANVTTTRQLRKKWFSPCPNFVDEQMPDKFSPLIHWSRDHIVELQLLKAFIQSGVHLDCGTLNRVNNFALNGQCVPNPYNQGKADMIKRFIEGRLYCSPQKPCSTKLLARDHHQSACQYATSATDLINLLLNRVNCNNRGHMERKSMSCYLPSQHVPLKLDQLVSTDFAEFIHYLVLRNRRMATEEDYVPAEQICSVQVVSLALQRRQELAAQEQQQRQERERQQKNQRYRHGRP